MQLVIRLLGCRLLGKVFALYALHTVSSQFRSIVSTWSYVTITLGFSCQVGDQNRILMAVLDLPVMQHQLVVLCARVITTKDLYLFSWEDLFQSSDDYSLLCC